MTERKPPGVRFETWIEKLIREATDRGEFDDLPGAGRPIADLAEPHDEDWWIKQKLRREDLVVLPASLLLRKEAEDALVRAVRARTEAEAREVIEAINHQILEGTRKAIEGPPHNLFPFDVDEVLARWRDHHPAPEPPPAPVAGAPPTKRRGPLARIRPVLRR